jgi:probable HAF family extracellular repeat protein
MKLKKGLSWLACACVSVGGVSAANAVDYTMVDLGTLGGSASRGLDINNSGMVVGRSEIPGDASRHGFTHNGGINDVGVPIGASGSSLEAVNNFGMGAGYGTFPGGARNPMVYVGGVWTDLGTLGGNRGSASDISDSGWMTGQSENNLGRSHAFRSIGAGLEDLLPIAPNGESAGQGINNAGDVVGVTSVQTEENLMRCCIWFNGTNTAVDLGTLGGDWSGGHDVNNQGTIVGYAMVPGNARHAALWGGEDLVIIDLGHLGGADALANGINENGTIVGSSAVVDGGEFHAFAMPCGNAMMDIHPGAGWISSEAHDVNDNGVIAGLAVDNLGNSHAVIWVPQWDVSIASSNPPNGAIDARQPTDLDGTNPQGWDMLTLTFDGPACDLGPDAFSVSTSGGLTPNVMMTMGNGNDVTLYLDNQIPVGEWTDVEHDGSGSEVQLGYLPADVNGDGTSSPVDILAVIDSLNGVTPRPIYSSDADRSGIEAPPDILRVVDLLNGAGAFDSWNGQTLP